MKIKKETHKIICLFLLFGVVYEFLLGRGQRALKKLLFTIFPINLEYKILLIGMVITMVFTLFSANLGYYNASNEHDFKILSTHSNNYVVLGTYQDYLITAKVDLKKNIISKDFYLINKAPSNEEKMNIAVFNIHKHLRVIRSDKITISTIN